MSTVSSPAPRQSNAAVLSWIGSLFAFDSTKFHPVEGVVATVLVVALLLILKALGHEDLLFSIAFGALYTRHARIRAINGVPVPGRTRWSLAFVLVGTFLTAIGYLLGGAAWEVVALAVLVTSFLSYLPSAYGPRAKTSAFLLNNWFLICLSSAFALGTTPAQTWPVAIVQALAWLAGGIFWLIVVWVWRVVHTEPQGDISSADQDPSAAHISRPLVAFAGLAAVAVALAAAVAWAFQIPDADWMVIAASIAMKPTFDASAYVAGQRVGGALVGAILAAILLTVVDDRTLLVVLIVILIAVGGALHDASYAIYCVLISTAVLIAMGLPHPGSFVDNWHRVVWTLVGVAISLLVTFVSNVARNRAPQPAAAT
jgi:hypothetical protein